MHGEVARNFLARETPAVHERRLRYLYEVIDIRRARENVIRLQEMYRGRCQICLFDPISRYGHRLCHGHHIHWLSRAARMNWRT